MRKLFSNHFVLLDGVAESPNLFVFPYFNDELGAAVSSAMTAADTVLLGRHMYDEWSAYWPGKTAEDDPFAGYINPVRKAVVSRTLKQADWNNTTIVGGDIERGIADLKAEPGGDIAVHGSLTLVGSLLDRGLLDELRLLVFPVVVGKGRHLFDAADERAALALVESRPFSTGVVALTYRPAGK